MSGKGRKRFGFTIAAIVAAFSMMTGAMLAPASSLADEAVSHPAHIHNGDCSAPGDVVAPLTNLVNSEDQEYLSQSASHIDLEVADMLATPHSLVVHLSDDEIGTYLACGNVTGTPDANGTLVVGLGQLGDSGKEGVALLTTNASGGTDVMAYLLEEPQVTGMAMPAASDDHPAHIHNGDCKAPGDVVFPLTNVTPTGDATNVLLVEGSATENIATSLADLTAAPHSIVAHLSADEIGTYLVCGDVTGTPDANGMIAIPLNEVAPSGYVGLALLKDNGDSTTSVWLYLVPGISGGMATPSGEEGEYATPSMEGMDMGTPAASAAGEQAIAIAGFAFDPVTIEVPVGTTVTWTNQDSAAHTVTSDDGTSFQSGKMDQGATFSYTFDTAGTFAYHCEYHAGMKATIVVK
jgi:plastocyanin